MKLPIFCCNANKFLLSVNKSSKWKQNEIPSFYATTLQIFTFPLQNLENCWSTLWPKVWEIVWQTNIFVFKWIDQTAFIVVDKLVDSAYTLCARLNKYDPPLGLVFNKWMSGNSRRRYTWKWFLNFSPRIISRFQSITPNTLLSYILNMSKSIKQDCLNILHQMEASTKYKKQ